MNSSKTWKSGEICRTSGTYQCQSCEIEGRQAPTEFTAGSVLPMCSNCSESDATWRLIGTLASSPAGA